MNFRTILHYFLGRVLVGIVALMAKINPPAIMTRSFYWTGEENKFKPYHHLMWNDVLYYQIDDGWVSYSESITEGMKILEARK